MVTKICNKCQIEKPVSAYQRDKRRFGLDSYFQQPCSKCRCDQRKFKRAANISKGKIEYAQAKHVVGFIGGTTEYKDLIKAKLALDEKIKSISNVYLKCGTDELIIGCNACGFIDKLPSILPIGQFENIIEKFKNYHNLCESTRKK
jgi:hypothetical protein